MSTSDTERKPFADSMEEAQSMEMKEFKGPIMVFGKTGSGVSSTVNSILGWDACPVGSGMHTTTQEIQSEKRKGENIQVIDMPDLVSMDREYNSDWKSRDVLSRWRCDPLQAALLVIRCDERYTAGQYEIYVKMREKLGDLISLDNLIVVFTHGKHFKEDVVQHASGELQRVLQDAGHQYVVLDNSLSDGRKKTDVCLLLTKVDRIRNPLAPERRPEWRLGDHFAYLMALNRGFVSFIIIVVFIIIIIIIFIIIIIIITLAVTKQ